MVEEPIAYRAILAVFPFREDRTSLETILGDANWDLRFTATFEEARSALRAFSFGAVISEGHLPDGQCWKDLLREIQDIAGSPPLIVVERFADEWLWAEVLNLGGYDVLMKPFDAKEVLHAVTMACHFCDGYLRQHIPLRITAGQRMSALPKPAKTRVERLPESAVQTTSARD